MKIIVKPVLDNLDSYIENNIDTFLLPLEEYSVSYIKYYSLDDIKAIRKKYEDINIFISINKNIFNSEIEPLKKILQELDKLNIEGIFFYDLAILSLKKELSLKTELVWNSTFMVTNYKTCNYYFEKGVKYALISKEITKDEIIDIVNNTKIKTIVELISYPTVAFSKRHLVTNYYKNYDLNIKDSINVIEPISKQKYLIKEDKNGTSFILEKLMNGSRILKELMNTNLEYILLQEDLIEHDIFIKCINNINYYIKNYHNMSDNDYNNWIKKQNELLGRNTNFFYRKTIYKVK